MLILDTIATHCLSCNKFAVLGREGCASFGLHAARREGRGGLKAAASRANEPPRPKGRGFITVDLANEPPAGYRLGVPGFHDVDPWPWTRPAHSYGRGFELVLCAARDGFARVAMVALLEVLTSTHGVSQVSFPVSIHKEVRMDRCRNRS